jgi:hypothetical protein
MFEARACPPHKLGFVNPKLGAHLPNRFKLGGGFLGLPAGALA